MKTTLKLLLVEDNPGDADLLRTDLEGVSEPFYVITGVQRLGQAIELLGADHFDLVVLDLGLPDSSGLETLRKIVIAAPDLPIVVLTGILEETMGSEAVKLGAQDFLNKHQINSQVLSRVLRYAYERKQAEIARRNAERQVQTILDALDIQVLLMDLDHRIQWTNRKVCEAFGLSRDEVIGKFCYHLWPDQDRLCQNCPVEKAKVTASHQMEYRRPKNNKFWDIKVFPVMNGQGEIGSIVELRTDITERINLEEQFYQAQKMEAVGRLAGGVAHDFNNMLSVILGCAEMAKGKASKETDLQEYLDEILEAGRRSADLIRQLMVFSRKENISPQLLNYNDHIENSQKMLKRLVGEDIEIRFRTCPDLWDVLLDPAQLDQIIVNLTVNSRDAIRGGGLLTIETANTVLDEQFCRRHVHTTPGEYILLMVSDTGHGMTKEVLAQIFEPFFTTKKRGMGTGLGMSTIFGIVKQNGGVVNVDSEINKGTTVKIYFPRFTGDTANIAGRDNLSSDVGNETILIVEDDQAIIRICRAILIEAGYTTLTADDPLKVEQLVQQYTGDLHLLITDTIMPHMNGMELKQTIEKLRPTIKTLFMSGYPADIVSSQGVVTDDVNFLQKPFNKEQLKKKVREILNGDIVKSGTAPQGVFDTTK